MKKTILFLLLLSTALFLSGCGEEEEGEEQSSTVSGVQGWHFQGRDCLACHNVDLQEEKNLLFGGTLYKDQNITDQDDLNNVCGGKQIINLYDSGFNLTYSSKDYEDLDSKGYKGKGNIFILKRMLYSVSPGDYYVQITDENANVLAVSTQTHAFSSLPYDINNSADINNRVSCNSCHIKGGVQAPLFAQINKNLCE
ncbi:hypothetical protein KJ877_06145 [bacterium]|nr:hypothetical protein [bacterium]MBU1989766.1 hypothetical protein [bacterium]